MLLSIYHSYSLLTTSFHEQVDGKEKEEKGRRLDNDP